MPIKYIHIYSAGSLCENNEIIPLASCLFCFGLVVDVVVVVVVVHFVIGCRERVRMVSHIQMFLACITPHRYITMALYVCSQHHEMFLL